MAWGGDGFYDQFFGAASGITHIRITSLKRSYPGISSGIQVLEVWALACPAS